eukprot:Nk52_evm11s539 gene=Nk52_evmTU11s539
MESAFRAHILGGGDAQKKKQHQRLPPAVEQALRGRNKDDYVKLYGEIITLLKGDGGANNGNWIKCLEWLVENYASYPLDMAPRSFRLQFVGEVCQALKRMGKVGGGRAGGSDSNFASLSLGFDNSEQLTTLTLEILPMEDILFWLLHEEKEIMSVCKECDDKKLPLYELSTRILKLPIQVSDIAKPVLLTIFQGNKSCVNAYLTAFMHVEKMMKALGNGCVQEVTNINAKLSWYLKLVNMAMNSFSMTGKQIEQVYSQFKAVTINGTVILNNNSRVYISDLLNQDCMSELIYARNLLKQAVGKAKPAFVCVDDDNPEDVRLDIAAYRGSRDMGLERGSTSLQLTRVKSEEERLGSAKVDIPTGNANGLNAFGSIESLRNTGSSSSTIILSKDVGPVGPSSIERPPFDRCIADVPSVWLQVDPIPDRIVFSPEEFDSQEHDEILTSLSAGTFLMTKDDLIWQGNEKAVVEEENQKFNSKGDYSDLGLAISLKDITQYSFGIVTKNAYARNAKFLKNDEAEKSPPVYYLTIVKEEAYKFFPFNEMEITRLIESIQTLIGIPPFAPADFVKKVIHSRLLKTRITVLRHLESLENPWIEHTQQLKEVIKKLTKENIPHSIYDLERLYHSCRLQTEVAKEALHILRQHWKDAPSEQVRLKILIVLDRLLDKTVMHPRHENFNRFFRLLQQLERNLDPYKSCEALKCILKLLQRANELRNHGLSSLTQNQFPVLFENWDDYVVYSSHA